MLDFTSDMTLRAGGGFADESDPDDLAFYSDRTVQMFSPRLRTVPADTRVNQKTLKSAISFSGIGLHSGQYISVRLEPADPDTGIVFQRTDISASPLPARYDYVTETRLCTMLGHPDEKSNVVGTVEHLMAALSAAGLTNLYVLIDGAEVPVLDGSAADFVFLLNCAGIHEQPNEQLCVHILKTVRVEQGDAWTELSPGRKDCFSVDLKIRFPVPSIGEQTFSFELNADTFREQIADSRTFVMRQEIDALRAAGLARGGSLKNALVVEHDRILNPEGLRVRDEFVRHKTLDVIGDLALASAPLRGCFRGYKSGHALNNLLLRKLFSDPEAWSFRKNSPAGKKSSAFSVAA